jgi:hypothetical protein
MYRKRRSGRSGAIGTAWAVGFGLAVLAGGLVFSALLVAVLE